jgi:predicted Rossmann fold flavoprotein
MDKQFDVIIIGGGAAGIMAAISTKRQHPEYSVAILDRTFALGRKILVCGAGRCNVTNINLNSDSAKRYYGAEQGFIRDVLSQFGFQNIVDFFADLGVELYVERKTSIGKLFPVTDQAKTITAVLEDELNRLGVEVFLNTEVAKVSKSDAGFKISAHPVSLETKAPTAEFLIFNSKFLILSAGGKTYPALGSNGSGYGLAEQLGHQIITPVPSALPLEGKNQLSHLLQGLKLEIEATSLIDGNMVKSSVDDVMFTQYGLSGPAILNISREISIALNREQGHQAQVILNFFPGKSIVEVEKLLQARWQKRPTQTIERSLYGLFPNKVAAALVQISDIPPTAQSSELTATQISTLINHLTTYMVVITATRGWNEAEFTAGGIATTEINSHTLESKLVKNLYACGEILNVDGDVGGFNLSWAWSSGHLVGRLS